VTQIERLAEEQRARDGAADDADAGPGRLISELPTSGLVPRFSLPSLWAFARIR
jgi:hypothetical protein